MKNRTSLFRAFIALTLAFCLITNVFAFSQADISKAFSSVSSYEVSEVAPDVNHLALTATNANGKQNINAIEFSPKNPLISLRAGLSAGYVYSVQTVNTIANNMSDVDGGGDIAVAAINGDFYDFGVGVPHGVFIDEGRILSTPPQYYGAFGLTYDNKPFIVRHGTILDKIFIVDGVNCNITGINNAHKKGESSLMLYTADYARGTKTGATTYELLCRVDSGEPRHGETLVFTVEKIFDSVGNTALSDGYIVLSAQGERIADLKKLSVGEKHEITFRFTEFWSNVKFAVGGIELLLKDGQIYSTKDTSKQPRTSIGIRPDGSVVMATIDGRQTSAVGMSYKTAAETMLALGCVDALNLDGGGSTTFSLRTPGAMTTSVANKVSGSSARQVANAVVLMNTAPSTTPKTLTISPENRYILLGGKGDYNVVATYDENYKPFAVPQNIEWLTNSVGTIDSNGTFYAEESGSFLVEARSGEAFGSAAVTVYDRVDTISANADKSLAKPGDTINFSVSATNGGKTLETSPDLFTWFAPEALGNFNEPGKLTLSEYARSGIVRVSYGDVSKEILITVENSNAPFIPLTGFEGDSVSFIPVSIGTKVAPNSKIETDPKYVYDGTSSLKVYYNFLNTAGNVGSYYMISPASKDNSSYKLSNIPKKLGMFVYGDGSGIMLRSIIEDAGGKQYYISYGKLDHKGWKYMEAAIPDGITSEIYIKSPVNLVSNNVKLTHGCLYFDKLRAVYSSEVSDDVTPPEITKAWPSEGLMTYGRTPSIGVIMADAGSGIIPESVEIHVNGYNCTDRDFNTETGKISYTVKNALKPGYHTIYVRARDKAGNLLSKEWKFEVR